MPETVRGTLTWDGQRPRITYPARRRNTTTPVPQGQLAADLRPQKDPLEVDLEIEAGQPRRVRRVGAAWASDPANQSEPAGNQTGRAERRAPMASLPAERQDSEAGQPRFHNPYGFIGAPERLIDNPALGDHRGPSHARYHSDRWTGRIQVRLTVETPLLMPDAARCAEHDGHKTFPVRKTPGSEFPYLPSTSIKGMLRAAYEAVTNSRLGIFTGHARRLGFRMQATEGLAMVPGRVVGNEIELLMGTTSGPPLWSNNRWEVPGGLMYAAWLPRYRRSEKENLTYSDGSIPSPGDQVTFWAECIRHRARPFSYWQVLRVTRLSQPSPRPSGGDLHEFKGHVCVTNQNIDRKHDERIFFSAQEPTRIPVEPGWREAWQELIAEYQDLHETEIGKRRSRGQRPDQYLGREPGSTAFSRHVYTPGDLKLRTGALVYVRYGRDGKPIGLYPVMISRELHPLSPLQLLDESLRPATSLCELSPADRVFGWVRQEGNARPAAYRGNLRVGPVRCETPDAIENFQRPLPLAILGQPKPSQGRFYLETSSGKPLTGKSSSDAGYRAGNRVRGRKAYPHHRHLAAGHWLNPTQDRTQVVTNGVHQEYHRAGDPTREDWSQYEDDQNRSVEGWVRPGSQFAFDIHATNLSTVELGALLWLLDLGGDGRRFFRLGGGKPLGFGSVRLERVETSLATGEDLRRYYSEFDPAELPAADPDRLAHTIQAFKEAVGSAYGDGDFASVPFIRDFLTSFEGFNDRLPIHYPRVIIGKSPPPPSPKGENFKWFQQNNHPNAPRAALAPLAEDGGLPLYRDGQFRS